MKRILLAALLTLYSAIPTYAGELAFKLSLASYMTAAFVDTSSTSYALGLGAFREANPILRPIIERHGVVTAMALKGSIHTGLAWFLLSKQKKHPKAVLLTTLAIAGAQLAVDANNIHYLHMYGRQ